MKVKNKAVIKLGVTDAKSKKATQKALADIDGFSSYTLDFESLTLVVIGNIDPNAILNKLKKFVSAVLVSFGPEMDEGKSQKNDGGGGNIDQKLPVYGGGNFDQQHLPPVYRLPNYGTGPFGYDYPYHYF